MTEEMVKEKEFSPSSDIIRGKLALTELKRIIATRSDKLVINGKQYLYFGDWQLLGAFFGITARVVKTEQITQDRAVMIAKEELIAKETIGFHAWAEVLNANGKVISAAEAECLMDEPNWKSKARFQVLSMAETRACAKALRNCLSWIIRLPLGKQDQQPMLAEEIAEDQNIS